MRWSKSHIVLCALWLFFSSIAHAQSRPTGLEGYQVIRLEAVTPSRLELLRSWERDHTEFQIWSHELSIDGKIDARVSPRYLRTIEALGIPYEIAIEDVQAEIDLRYAATAGGSFFDSYRTNAEHAAFLQDLATNHPQLATVTQIGLSVQQRPIWSLHITSNNKPKPGVLFIGAQHGNEATNPAVLAYFAEHVLTNYGVDSAITDLLDDLELFVVPIVNPDGYTANSRYNAHGADLNRDWAVPGTVGPFSEPETAAVRSLMLAHPNIHGFIDFHTYGYYILWPWGYTPATPENHATFKTLADELAETIFAVRGKDYSRRGSAYSTLYPAVGVSIDYAFDSLNMWSFTLEVGGSYAVSQSDLVPTALDILPAAIHFCEWVVDCDGDGISNEEELLAGGTDCNLNGTVDTCESNNDGDSLIDPCDPDDDNDGVSDGSDVCPYAPIGFPVSSDGSPTVDVDQNCQVDLFDFGFYFEDLACLDESGPTVTSPAPRCRTFVDFDHDQDIDLRDVGVFVNQFSNPVH